MKTPNEAYSDLLIYVAHYFPWVATILFSFPRELKTDLPALFALKGTKILYSPKIVEANGKQLVSELIKIAVYILLGYCDAPETVKFSGPGAKVKWFIAGLLNSLSFILHYGLYDDDIKSEIPTIKLGDDQVSLLSLCQDYSAYELYKRLPDVNITMLRMQGQGQGSDQQPKKTKKSNNKNNLERLIKRIVTTFAAEEFEPIAQNEVQDYAFKRQMIQETLRSRGDVPQNLVDQIAAHTVETGIDWYSLLASVLTTKKEMTNWKRFNKRHLWRRIYYPALIGRALHAVACFDSSGSMSEEDIKLILGVLREICSHHTNYEFRVLVGDAAVHQDFAITPDDPLPTALEIKGRGGTDFRPFFEYIDEHILPETDIRCVLFFTDSAGIYPQAEPEYPVYWCLIDNVIEPPFGQIIYIDKQLLTS